MSLIMPTLKEELIYFQLDFLLSLSLFLFLLAEERGKIPRLAEASCFITNENISGWIEEMFVSLI